MEKKGKFNNCAVRYIVGILFILCVALGCVLFGALDSESLKRVDMVCVGVEEPVQSARKTAGTGVVFSTGGDGAWIATAAHLLENMDEEDVVTLLADGVVVRCETWVVAEDADIAFLFIPKMDTAGKTRVVFEKARTDKAYYDTLAAGDPVAARGYCNGEFVEYQGKLATSWIYVEDFGQHMMLAECQVNHGMSGGGLYDDAGNLIGMICGGNDQGELAAVPWHVMEAWFEELVQGLTFLKIW